MHIVQVLALLKADAGRLRTSMLVPSQSFLRGNGDRTWDGYMSQCWLPGRRVANALVCMAPVCQLRLAMLAWPSVGLCIRKEFYCKLGEIILSIQRAHIVSRASSR
jgi:hypothetical protein